MRPCPTRPSTHFWRCCSELGADDAYLQPGGKAANGEGRFSHALDDTTSVVAVFAEPAPDGAAVQARMAALSATFRKTLESAAAGVARPRQTDYARQRLDEELSGLSARAGAVRAFVFDLDSPVIWGASLLREQDTEAIKLIERASQLLRERTDELRQARGHTVRLTLEYGVEALVRPFAGLYVLVLLFRDPLSEPIALGAVLHAVGLIESSCSLCLPSTPSRAPRSSACTDRVARQALSLTSDSTSRTWPRHRPERHRR